MEYIGTYCLLMIIFLIGVLHGHGWGYAKARREQTEKALKENV